jgi:hypothetical protein
MEENIAIEGTEVDGRSSGSCPKADFDIDGAKLLVLLEKCTEVRLELSLSRDQNIQFAPLYVI